MTRRFPRPRRTSVLTAFAAAALVLAANSGLVGVGSAATGTPGSGAPAQPSGPQRASKSLNDTCVFGDPLGSKEVAVESSASIPALLTSGQKAAVTDFGMKFVLPRDVLDALSQPGQAASVEGGITAELTAVRDGKRTPIPVTLAIPTTPVPATGDLALTATGPVPDVVMTTAGQLEIETGAPTLTLSVKLADGSAPAQAAKPVVCTVDSGQDATLGTIVMLPPSKATGTPGGQNDLQDKASGSALASPQDDPDPNIFILPLQPFMNTGTSTIKKLGAVVPIGPAVLVNTLWYVNIVDPSQPSKIQGEMIIPPTHVTFLAFGFMPITATVEFLPPDYETGNTMNTITAFLTAKDDGTTPATSHIQVVGRLSDVMVNGVPLDVGSHCVTDGPVDIYVQATDFPAATGGVLKTDPGFPAPYDGFKIPDFVGCGATEPLSPILTGMSSGLGNQATVNSYSVVTCDQPSRPPGQPPCPTLDLVKKLAAEQGKH